MQSTARLDAIFAALADPTRRAILARLAFGQAWAEGRRLTVTQAMAEALQDGAGK